MIVRLNIFNLQNLSIIFLNRGIRTLPFIFQEKNWGSQLLALMNQSAIWTNILTHSVFDVRKIMTELNHIHVSSDNTSIVCPRLTRRRIIVALFSWQANIKGVIWWRNFLLLRNSSFFTFKFLKVVHKHDNHFCQSYIWKLPNPSLNTYI